MTAVAVAVATGAGVAGTLGAIALTRSPSDSDVSAQATPVVREHAYGPKVRHRLDTYLPGQHAATAPATGAAALLLVHGGAWTHGDKASMARLARTATAAGHVAVAVNYGLAPRQSWGTQRADLRRAARWVRARAEKLRIDPDKIFVLGSSAGGEAALSAFTTRAGARLVRGVATLSAPADLALVAADTTGTRLSAKLADHLTDDLLQCGETCGELLAARSVVSQLDRRDPAVLLFASRAEYVDPQSTLRLHATAKARQVDSTALLFEGTRHGMSYSADAMPQILAWIDERSDQPLS